QASRKTIRLCSLTRARKEAASASSASSERIPPIGFVRRNPGRKVRSNSGEIASTDRLTRRLDDPERPGLGKGRVGQPRRSVPAYLLPPANRYGSAAPDVWTGGPRRRGPNPLPLGRHRVRK